jgi:hypothetical protein
VSFCVGARRMKNDKQNPLCAISTSATNKKNKQQRRR